MKPVLFVPSLLAAVALAASVAFAGTSDLKQSNRHPTGEIKVAAAVDSAARCTALESQFDGAIKTHESAKKAAAAKTLRQEGGQLCASGKAAQGVKKLEQALNDIGLKPMKSKY